MDHLSADNVAGTRASDLQRAVHIRNGPLLHARFHGVLDDAPDAILLVDRSGRIALVNREAERLFGYGRAALLGHTVEELMPARFHASHATVVQQYFAHPRTRGMDENMRLLARRADGTEFSVDIKLSEVVVDQAQYAMAAIRDITERKRIEAALRDMNSELESFTHSVSHDLRAPIRRIDGLCEILAEEIDAAASADMVQLVERIRGVSQHMGRLVDDLLQLSRVGRQELQKRAVSLDEIVQRVIADLRPETEGRTVMWTVHPLPMINGDPGLMHIVFTNLLSNATKYTRRRDAAAIEVGVHDTPEGQVIFVRDNGVGFDMQHAQRLFGAFQRLHRTEDFEGTGVGLATVQRIVRKHGGTVWADAALDKGATFSFTVSP